MFKLTTIVLVLSITTAVNLFAFYISWQRRKGQGGTYFAFAVLSLTLWTFSSALDYAAVPISLKVFFAKWESLFYNIALATFFSFVLSYMGHTEWLRTRLARVVIWLPPTINILLTITNDWHGLFWAGFSHSEIGENIVIFHHGPAYFLVTITSYIAVLVMLAGLLRITFSTAEIRKRQARFLFFALLIPLSSNFLYQLELPGFAGIDWTSILFSISALLFLLALFGTHFLDIIPVARHSLIEGMDDCVLVLDTSDRVIDFNLATQDVFGISKENIGMAVEHAASHFSFLADETLPSSDKNLTITIGEQKDEIRYFDTNITVLRNRRQKAIAKMVVFREITDRYKIEAVLAKADERQRLARTLHDSVSQSIHSMVLFSETLTATLQRGDQERALQITERLQESARQSHKETRLLLYELQAEGPVRSVNLLEDIEERLNRVERHTGMKAEISFDGDMKYCPPAYVENLYWLIIESLNNAIKHAQATKIKVFLRFSPKRIEVKVRDNGVGFLVDKKGKGGMGMQYMHERAQLLNGQLVVESLPEEGTTVYFFADREVE